MKDFKKLNVWQKSIPLVKTVYQITSDFPSSELYGLTGQIRRSAVSIPSNIAEGAGRGDKEFSHFLVIAIGSSFELETQFIISKELGFITIEIFEDINSKIIAVQKMISGLQNSIKTT
jgi:four helix bundle protein